MMSIDRSSAISRSFSNGLSFASLNELSSPVPLGVVVLDKSATRFLTQIREWANLFAKPFRVRLRRATDGLFPFGALQHFFRPLR